MMEEEKKIDQKQGENSSQSDEDIAPMCQNSFQHLKDIDGVKVKKEVTRKKFLYKSQSLKVDGPTLRFQKKQEPDEKIVKFKPDAATYSPGVRPSSKSILKKQNEKRNSKAKIVLERVINYASDGQKFFDTLQLLQGNDQKVHEFLQNQNNNFLNLFQNGIDPNDFINLNEIFANCIEEKKELVSLYIGKFPEIKNFDEVMKQIYSVNEEFCVQSNIRFLKCRELLNSKIIEEYEKYV